MHLSHRFAAGVLAASLVASGAGSAFAKGSKVQTVANRAAAYGQVSGLSNTGFTLTTPARTTRTGQTVASRAIAVATAATTRIAPRKGETAALANGDYAVVIGTKNDTGIAATRVVYSAQAFNRAGTRVAAVHRAHRAAGTVTASSATSLTIQTRAGKSVTFSIVPATQFRVAGTKAAAARTVNNGQTVRVLYTINATDKSRVARVVVIGTAATK